MIFNQEAELVGGRRKCRSRLLLQDLEYADDMALVADSMDGLEHLLQTLDACCAEMGLTVSTEKTKILAILRAPPLTHEMSCWDPAMV